MAKVFISGRQVPSSDVRHIRDNSVSDKGHWILMWVAVVGGIYSLGCVFILLLIFDFAHDIKRQAPRFLMRLKRLIGLKRRVR